MEPDCIVVGMKILLRCMYRVGRVKKNASWRRKEIQLLGTIIELPGSMSSKTKWGAGSSKWKKILRRHPRLSTARTCHTAKNCSMMHDIMVKQAFSEGERKSATAFGVVWGWSQQGNLWAIVNSVVCCGIFNKWIVWRHRWDIGMKRWKDIVCKTLARWVCHYFTNQFSFAVGETMREITRQLPSLEMGLPRKLKGLQISHQRGAVRAFSQGREGGKTGSSLKMRAPWKFVTEF